MLIRISLLPTLSRETQTSSNDLNQKPIIRAPKINQTEKNLSLPPRH